MDTIDTVKQKLTSAFAPDHLEVVDESEQHRGHGGFREGVSTHLRVHIRAAVFAGKGRVAAQRMVYSTLQAELEGDVHALALKVES